MSVLEEMSYKDNYHMKYHLSIEGIFKSAFKFVNQSVLDTMR